MSGRIVRYTVPVYVYLNDDEDGVEKVVVDDEHIELDYDRLNHEHFPEVIMDPDEMDIPGPLERIWRNPVLSEAERNAAWDEAERLVRVAEDPDNLWPAWDHGW